MKALLDALAVRGEDYKDALSRFRILVEADPYYDEQVQALREAVELVRCLRRLLEKGTFTAPQLHQAFGAPGDFGYDTAIGDALAKLYGVRS